MQSVFDGRSTQTVNLPTYAFQRQRFWLDANRIGQGDPASQHRPRTLNPFLGGGRAGRR
ncbi:type I polyketide synthase domain protein [Mycobacterium ulcerans str. Harvey]|uniref:Type I polyketide synthase domain protein n=1 Tax=Mycobacterium ulcerans str. Harvey TaxID=1299332 RepID=A0ABN0RAX5_MYCUL|nr:type I polyketide synthase domain protein [Mycobacterium ulcerans str. Harvey]